MSDLSCRSCSGQSLSLILDLGLMPPSSRFLTPALAALPEPIHPLRLLRCDGCGLLQTEPGPTVDHDLGSLAAADDPHAFVRGLPGNRAVFELPNLQILHDHLAYDLICHEARCYWSVTQLRELLREHGMVLVDVEARPDHAGTLRVTTQRLGGSLATKPSVAAALARERAAELDRPQAWADFAMLVEQSRDLLNSELEEWQFRGKSVAAYSSNGRGMTTLAYCAAALRLPCVIDDCPALHGLLTPEDRIPIVGPDVLRYQHFDVLLLLGREWDASADGPLRDFWEAGGRVLVPTPKPHYVDPAPAPHLTERFRGSLAAPAFADFG